VSSPEAGLLPKSVTDQHSDADDQYSKTLSITDEATPDCQDIAVYKSRHNVEHLGKPEAVHSTQLIKLEEHSESRMLTVSKDQQLVLADSVADSKLTTQQMPKTKQFVIDDESEQEESASERHVIPYQEDQLKDEYQEVQEAIVERIEKEPAESAFDAPEVSDSLLQTTVCVDDFTGDDKISAMLFGVCSDEPSTPEFERQPVSLPTLSDLASTAVVSDVSQRQLAQPDISASCIVYCVDPIIYELPVEELAPYDLEVSEIDAMHVDMPESEYFAEATVKLPETECGVQELTIPDLFGEFVVPLHSPEAVTMTCCEVEVPEDLLVVVEPGESKASSGTSAMEGMSVVEDDSSLMMTLPASQIQSKKTAVKLHDSVQYEAVCFPENPETAKQVAAETCVKSDEFYGAKSRLQSEADLPMIWKYRSGERQAGSRDSDGEMPKLEAKHHDSYGEHYSIRHFMKEDASDRSPFSFGDVETRHEYHSSDDDDEQEAESTTSEEWCVMEMEHDFGLYATSMEDLLTQKHEQEITDIGTISALASKPVYDTSTQETSSEYLINRTSCTSKRCLYSD